MHIRFFTASLIIFCISIRAGEESLPSFKPLSEKIDTLCTPGKTAEEYDGICITILDHKSNLADEHKKKLWSADIIAQLATIQKKGSRSRPRWNELANYNPCFKLIEFYDLFEEYKKKEDGTNSLNVWLESYKKDNNYKNLSHPAYTRLQGEYSTFGEQIIRAGLHCINKVVNNLNGHESVDVDGVKRLGLPAVIQYLARDSKDKAALWKNDFLKAAKQVKTQKADKWNTFEEALKGFNPSCALLEAEEALDKNDLGSAEKILNEHRLTCLNCVACPELKEKPLSDIQMDMLMSQHILNDAFKILQQRYRTKKLKAIALQEIEKLTTQLSPQKAVILNVGDPGAWEPEQQKEIDSLLGDSSTGQSTMSGKAHAYLSELTSVPVEGETPEDQAALDALAKTIQADQDKRQKEGKLPDPAKAVVHPRVLQYRKEVISTPPEEILGSSDNKIELPKKTAPWHSYFSRPLFFVLSLFNPFAWGRLLSSFWC